MAVCVLPLRYEDMYTQGLYFEAVICDCCAWLCRSWAWVESYAEAVVMGDWLSFCSARCDTHCLIRNPESEKQFFAL